MNATERLKLFRVQLNLASVSNSRPSWTVKAPDELAVTFDARQVKDMLYFAATYGLKVKAVAPAYRDAKLNIRVRYSIRDERTAQP